MLTTQLYDAAQRRFEAEFAHICQHAKRLNAFGAWAESLGALDEKIGEWIVSPCLHAETNGKPSLRLHYPATGDSRDTVLKQIAMLESRMGQRIDFAACEYANQVRYNYAHPELGNITIIISDTNMDILYPIEEAA